MQTHRSIVFVIFWSVMASAEDRLDPEKFKFQCDVVASAQISGRAVKASDLKQIPPVRVRSRLEAGEVPGIEFFLVSDAAPAGMGLFPVSGAAVRKLTDDEVRIRYAKGAVVLQTGARLTIDFRTGKGEAWTKLKSSLPMLKEWEEELYLLEGCVREAT